MDRLRHGRPRKPCCGIDRFVGRYTCRVVGLLGRSLAYSGIQMQIEEERRKAAIRQVQAKATAVIAITQAIHAAAATLDAVTQAQKAQVDQQQTYWDNRIKQGVS